MAFGHLGLGYSAIREAALSAEATARAYQLRDRASDPERFYIAAMYDRQVTGNLERELQTLTLWAQTYPRDPIAHGLLSKGRRAENGHDADLTEQGLNASYRLSPPSPVRV